MHYTPEPARGHEWHRNLLTVWNNRTTYTANGCITAATQRITLAHAGYSHILHNEPENAPKLPLALGDLGPHLMHGSTGPHSKWHLDRFSCYSTARGYIQQTHTPQNAGDNRPNDNKDAGLTKTNPSSTRTWTGLTRARNKPPRMKLRTQW